MNSAARKSGFRGKLGNVSILDIIQMSCLTQRTGEVSVRFRTRHATVLLDHGQIRHAQTSQAQGPDALLEVLQWPEGKFTFRPLPNIPASYPRSFAGGWESNLMDAVRKRDELLADQADHSSANLPRDLAGQLLDRIQREQSRSVRINRWRWFVLGAGLLLMVVGAVSYLRTPGGRVRWIQLRGWVERLARPAVTSVQPKATREVEIPAGAFIYQDGQRIILSAYDIDETEVTIGQYAQFLNAVGHNQEFDHPAQPLGKSHRNPAWDQYYAAAQKGTVFGGIRLNLSFPAAYLDWFDAYAYAKWRGRRLPTEPEWEKAARGTDGRRYPWGMNFVPDGANLRSEVPQEVGHFPRDVSPFGVLDLAGNVSEWTSSEDGSGNVWVRGGNFSSGETDLTTRFSRSPFQIDRRIGFRTVRQ